MILSAHQGFMPKGKPYDAEVEYLESTGTQWIDTGIYGEFELDFNIKFVAHIEKASWHSLMGDRVSASSRRYTVLVAGTSDSGAGYVNCGDGNQISIPAPKSYLITTISKVGELVYKNSKLISGSFSAKQFTTQNTIALFATRTNGVFSNPFLGKIYNASFSKNGELVRDFIPVRKGDVGYMYDKVSGKLFGNSGTGDFVLGADKKPTNTTISAKSYVQDGIIAQWDGVENVGYGEHDNSTNVWKDLVGGFELTATNDNYHWESNAVVIYKCGFTNATSVIGFNGMYFVEAVFAIDQLTVGSVASIFSSGGTTTQKRNQIYVNSQTPPTMMCGANGDILNHFDFSDWVGKPLSVTNDSINRRMLRNGQVVTETSGTEGYNGSSSGTLVGYAWAATTVGRLMAIRIYNRALTDAEIAHNYAVDKERFGI